MLINLGWPQVTAEDLDKEYEAMGATLSRRQRLCLDDLRSCLISILQVSQRSCNPVGLNIAEEPSNASKHWCGNKTRGGAARE